MYSYFDILGINIWKLNSILDLAETLFKNGYVLVLSCTLLQSEICLL